jgi:uncharacterized membrane-anchored protein YitT (DUF2179 family)
MKQKTLNPKLKEILTDIVYLCISGMLFAIAYNMFFVPGAIFIGGAGGIATALNILFNIPTGTMIILINIPLVALFMIFYGAKSAVKGIIGILVSSIFVDGTAMLGIFGEIFPNAAESRLLCAILGGLVLGAAVAFMFARGYSTGGSDLIAFLVKIFLPNASTPNVIFGVEACVVLIASLITNDTISTIVMSIFFSIICTFMQTNALSTINGGFDKTRVAYIFSDKYEEIANAMMKDLKRGVTIIDGQGWYTKEEKKIIFCVVKKNEIFPLKTLVRHMDENAFMILSEATETIGRGFKAGVGDVVIEPKKKRKQAEKK